LFLKNILNLKINISIGMYFIFLLSILANEATSKTFEVMSGVNVKVSSQHVKVAEPVHISILIDTKIYRKYRFQEINEVFRVFEKKEKEDEKKDEKEDSEQIPLYEVDRFSETDSISQLELKTSIIYFKAGKYLLPDFKIILETFDGQIKNLELPAIEINVISSFESDPAADQNARDAKEVENFDIMWFNMNYLNLIYLSSVILILLLSVYVFREKIRNFFAGYFNKSEPQVILPPVTKDAAFENFKKELERIKKEMYIDKADFKILFSELEYAFLDYLSVIYRIRTHNYTVKSLMRKLAQIQNPPSEMIMAEMEEMMQIWLLYKYAKREPDLTTLQGHIMKTGMISETILQMNKDEIINVQY